MTKEITITVSGSQTDEEGNVLQSKHTGNGTFYEKEEALYVLYDETDPENGSVTKNMLKIKGDEVSLKRKGHIQSQMNFCVGEESVFDYRTPLGLLKLGLSTQKLKVLQSPHQITVKVNYTLASEGMFLTSNRLFITINSVEG